MVEDASADMDALADIQGHSAVSMKGVHARRIRESAGECT